MRTPYLSGENGGEKSDSKKGEMKMVQETKSNLEHPNGWEYRRISFVTSLSPRFPIAVAVQRIVYLHGDKNSGPSHRPLGHSREI